MASSWNALLDTLHDRRQGVVTERAMSAARTEEMCVPRELELTGLSDAARQKHQTSVILTMKHESPRSGISSGRYLTKGMVGLMSGGESRLSKGKEKWN